MDQNVKSLGQQLKTWWKVAAGGAAEFGAGAAEVVGPEL